MSPQCASSSDTVREIKYQILHLTHPREAHLLPLVKRFIEMHQRGTDRGGRRAQAAWRRAEGAGLTAKARTERSSMSPQCASSSDTVREIKYQILHLTHPREAHLLPLVKRFIEMHQRGTDRGGRRAHRG